MKRLKQYRLDVQDELSGAKGQTPELADSGVI